MTLVRNVSRNTQITFLVSLLVCYCVVMSERYVIELWPVTTRIVGSILRFDYGFFNLNLAPK